MGTSGHLVSPTFLAGCGFVPDRVDPGAQDLSWESGFTRSTDSPTEGGRTHMGSIAFVIRNWM